jgi:choice-of-anchor C domain-containing protein
MHAAAASVAMPRRVAVATGHRYRGEDALVKRRSSVSAAIAVVASLVLAGSALAAFAGVINGSFENGTNEPGTSEQLNAGSTVLTGWAISSGSVDWIGTYWKAADGTKSVDMNGAGPGAISQILATKAGKTYVVAFSLSANPAGGSTVRALTVGATGSASQSFTFDRAAHANTVSNMMWQSQQYSFVATVTSTTLTFTSGEATGPFGPALDKVVVTETASAGSAGGPGAACKSGGWKTMVDKAGNHFKNQGDCVSNFASKGKNPGAIKS